MSIEKNTYLKSWEKEQSSLFESIKSICKLKKLIFLACLEEVLFMNASTHSFPAGDKKQNVVCLVYINDNYWHIDSCGM